MTLRKFAMAVAFAGLVGGSTLLLAGDDKPAPHKEKDPKAAEHKADEHKDHKAADHKAADGHEKKKQ